MKARYEYPDGRIVELPANEPQPEGTVFVGFVDRANPLKIDTDLVLAWLVAEYGDLEGGKKFNKFLSFVNDVKKMRLFIEK